MLGPLDLTFWWRHSVITSYSNILFCHDEWNTILNQRTVHRGWTIPLQIVYCSSNNRCVIWSYVTMPIGFPMSFSGHRWDRNIDNKYRSKASCNWLNEAVRTQPSCDYIDLISLVIYTNVCAIHRDHYVSNDGCHSTHVVQLNLDISWSNITQNCIQPDNNNGEISVGSWTHKRHFLWCVHCDRNFTDICSQWFN